MNIRNFTIRVLFLVLGSFSMAFASTDSKDEKWDTDKVANTADPALAASLQGATTASSIKPDYKDCEKCRELAHARDMRLADVDKKAAAGTPSSSDSSGSGSTDAQQ